MMNDARQLSIPSGVLRELIQQCRDEAPAEACGLLIGADAVVSRRLPMRNIADNRRTRYAMDPGELIATMKELRATGLRLLAIYHSHPDSPAVPSATDRALAFYPDAVYVIVSLMNRSHPEIKAYHIVDEVAAAVKLLIIDQSPV